ncbi:MAG: DUF1624 domain-containing protein [Oscillospiraceae bacterium]|nr:DUF1624 domain-containing protein [Oscillospiraceae bacterium]
MRSELPTNRLGLLDTLRGFLLLEMFLYHAAWDLVYLFGVDWPWFAGTLAYVWQQSICWGFVLLSGFCYSLGRQPWRRGMAVFGAGVLVTVVTLLVMPKQRVLFGVLTLLGSCMLLLAPLREKLNRFPAWAGLLGALLCFGLTRNLERGYLGFEGWNLLPLPGELYRNLFTAYLGFPPPAFFSTDYFSLFPWGFLFLAGYFLGRLCLARPHGMLFRQISPLSRVGRYSLPLYLIHQPAIYVILTLFMVLRHGIGEIL